MTGEQLWAIAIYGILGSAGWTAFVAWAALRQARLIVEAARSTHKPGPPAGGGKPS